MSALVCDHCGLECTSTVYESHKAERTLHFCCLGCKTVYAILQRGDAEPAPKPVFSGPVEERMFHLSGLWCSACGWLIEHTLLREPGVVRAEVYFVSDLLKVTFYPQYFPISRVPEKLQKLGYRATEYQPDRESSTTERNDLLLRLVAAAFLWMNVMGLNLAVYFEAFEKPLPFLAMAVSLPVILYSAQPILRLAWRGLRNGTLRMESLLSLGILAAFGYSVWQGFTGGTHIYFDIACAITTFVLLGKWIEQGAKQRAAQTISTLHRMLPSKARMLQNGSERFVSIEALRTGDEFVVRAGERIPADGVVVAGLSQADESLLTGESTPVGKRPESKVVSGSLNLTGVLTIRTSTVGPDSTIARIVAAVERALSSRSEIERKVDRVSRLFVPAVIALALLVVFLSPGTDSLMRAITILVIACPCALGIATPLAVTAAVSAASRHGILVRDSRVIESLRTIDTVILDKTGTVTDADFSLLDVEGEGFELVASLEAYSEHPLARAIARRAQALKLQPATEVEILRGQGIRGVVNGHRVVVGNRSLAGGQPAGAGESTVAYYSIDGVPSGRLTFGNRVRESAVTLVDGLHARGVKVWLVSGDSESTTAAVARRIHADGWLAETRPEAKIEFIDKLKREGRCVAMVGDGINDAPALAAANLGIAMGSGTDLAMQSAAMVLMSGQLNRVLDAFDLSARTSRVVRQNLFWAFFYNVLGIGIAITGMLNPIIAAAAMVTSSLSVIGNSYRLSRYRLSAEQAAGTDRGAPSPQSASLSSV